MPSKLPTRRSHPVPRSAPALTFHVHHDVHRGRPGRRQELEVPREGVPEGVGIPPRGPVGGPQERLDRNPRVAGGHLRERVDEARRQERGGPERVRGLERGRERRHRVGLVEGSDQVRRGVGRRARADDEERPAVRRRPPAERAKDGAGGGVARDGRVDVVQDEDRGRGVRRGVEDARERGGDGRAVARKLVRGRELGL